MANPFLSQILGSVLGGGMGRGGGTGGGGSFGGGGMGGGGPFGGGAMGGGAMGGGGLGGILGSVLGSGGGMPMGVPRGGGMGGMGMGGMGGGRSAMLAMLLPLAMQWIQRSGGIGNVLQRTGQQGYGRHAQSWLSTGDNEPLSPQAVQDLVGQDELARMSSQLGVGQDEVADGFAEILPEMVDHLSPEGQLHGDADQRLDAGQSTLQQMLSQLR